jgi:hypothetical protein
MSKQFDPDKCPYSQLKDLKKNAIVFVEPTEEDSIAGSYSRIRRVSPRKHKTSWAASYCSYATVSHDGRESVFGRSCFSADRSSLRNTVNSMRRYDRNNYLQIVHIDFEE